MGVFDFDLVDDVDAEVHVHGFVTQNILELLGGAGHFIAASQGENLNKTDVEKDSFEDDVKGDEFAQQFLVIFRRSGLEGGVASDIE